MPTGRYTSADLAPAQQVPPKGRYTMADVDSISDTPRPAGLPAGMSLPGVSAHPAVTLREPAPTFGSLLRDRLQGNAEGLVRPFVHPIDTVKGMRAWDPSDESSYGTDLVTDFRDAPDFKTGAANALGDALTSAATSGAFELGGRLPAIGKGFIRGNINEKIPGTNVSPLRRYQDAKALGVNLDAADATNSPMLKAIKHVNENSLFGGPRYETLKGRNIGALQDSTSGLLDSMYAGDRESGGRIIQDALRSNHSGLRTGAESGFERLSSETQGQRIPGAPHVGESATRLLDTIEPLASRYPSLAPNQTIRILNDLSRVGSTPRVPSLGFLDAPGSEFAVPQKLPQPKPDTWSDLQRLRSATHDLTVSNPDLVKSQALAPLQVMTSALDDAMTNASSGLTPEQQNLFRQSNSQWKEMKQTYDDPSSPLYHAVRTENPSTLYGGIGPKTPENAVSLSRRLSPEGSGEALGAMRRGTVEGALRESADGSPNFPRFASRLRTIPADYRAELFSPDQNVQLERIANTSNLLAKDFNPSGSGKLGQKLGEAAALIPTGGAPLLQYPIARAMTSPRVTEFLMSPSKPNPLFFNAGAAIGSRLPQPETAPRKRRAR